MKYLFLLILVCYSISNYAQSEERDIVKEYIRTLSLNDNYPYVYSYTTKGGKMKEYYFYYKKKNLYVLAFFESGVDSVKEKFFQSDMLFDSINHNQKPLIKLKETKRNVEKFRKDFADSTNYFTQIGIRISGLHYNHFQQTDEKNLGSIKDEKKLKGCILINSIAAFFEKQIPGKLTK